MEKLLKILFWIFVGLVFIQFIPVDRTNPPVKQKINFVEIKKPPKEIENMIKNSCYDCHSYETKYPKYAYVAPISWSIKSHVNKGREYLNFSVWGNYNQNQKKHILENIIDEVESGRMPLPAYLPYHREAQISGEKRKIFNDYFQKILDSENY